MSEQNELPERTWMDTAWGIFACCIGALVVLFAAGVVVGLWRAVLGPLS